MSICMGMGYIAAKFNVKIPSEDGFQCNMKRTRSHNQDGCHTNNKYQTFETLHQKLNEL